MIECGTSHDGAVRHGLAGLALLAALLAPAPATAAETRDVQLRQTDVRAAPGPFAEIRGQLSYGTSVQILEAREGWVRVRSSDRDLQGWVRTAAVTERDIALKAGEQEAQVEATEDEIATAAKGFNERVEKKYKKKKDIDYTWVDRMEKIEIANDSQREFLKQGNLRVR